MYIGIYMRTSVIFFILSLTFVFSCGRQERHPDFNDTLSGIAVSPAKYLDAHSADTVLDLNRADDAEEFVLRSLALNYIDASAFPDSSSLYRAVETLGRDGRFIPVMEARFLIAEMYRNSGNTERSIEEMLSCLEVAEEYGSAEWKFFLYSHIANLYLRAYSIVPFFKYQAMAEESVQGEDIAAYHIVTRLTAAENYLYMGRTADAMALAGAAEREMVSAESSLQARCKRIIGLCMYKSGNYDEAVNKLGESLAHEKSVQGRFTVYSVLMSSYLALGKDSLALLCRDSAAVLADDAPSYYHKLAFYRNCASQAGRTGDRDGQITFLEKLDEAYSGMMSEFRSRVMDDVFSSYEKMREKRMYDYRSGIYKNIIILVLLMMLALFAVYYFYRKRIAEKIIGMQGRMLELENSEKSYIMRDIESAKNIARKEYALPERDRHILEEMKRDPSLKGNDLISRNWDVFFRHIDICYDGFYSSLRKNYPVLNDRELQLCCMLVAGMRTDEIAGIWQMSVYSVYKYKTGIRKKISMDSGSDIVAFLKERFR